MAIEYTLYASEPISQIPIPGALRDAVAHPRGYSLPGCFWVAMPVGDRVAEFVEESQHLVPAEMIIFRLDKFDQVLASRQLAVALRALVDNSDGELLLLFNGEHVVLRRDRKCLWLDEQSLPMQYFVETAPE